MMETSNTRYKRYTKSDDKKTQEYLDLGMTWEQIAGVLGRTARSVQSRHISVTVGIAEYRGDLPDKTIRGCNLCNSRVPMSKFERFCGSCRSHRVNSVAQGFGL